MSAVLDYSEREVWTGSRWEPAAELRIMQRRWGRQSITSEMHTALRPEVLRLQGDVDGQLGLHPSDGL